MIYFLLPRVRKPFLDKRSRWWESSDRFAVRLPVNVIDDQNKKTNVVIENISLTGCLLVGDINEGCSYLDGEFTVLEKKFTFSAKRVRKSKITNENAFGFMFLTNKKERKELKGLMKALKILSKNDVMDNSVNITESTLEEVS